MPGAISFAPGYFVGECGENPQQQPLPYLTQVISRDTYSDIWKLLGKGEQL